LRTKAETTEKLRSYFDEATTLNTKTKVKNMRTASGIKDTFQLVFLEKLFVSYKNKRGKPARQAALAAEQAKLPKTITSPVWRIEGPPLHITFYPGHSVCEQVWTPIVIPQWKYYTSFYWGL
jgi:hypothetical protein